MAGRAGQAMVQGPPASSAALLVSEYVRGPEDLNRIAAIRKKLAAERSGIEAKLKSGAKDQLDATRDGLLKLRETRTAVTATREEMVNVERLCEDPKAQIEGFSKISEVSRVHRQFVKTLEMVDSLRGMYDKLDWLEELLQADRADPLGPATNLLVVHYHLTQLEAFRNETVHQAKRATPESRATLERYFARLSGVITAFDDHYLGLAGSLIQIVRNGHPGVAVKIAKIAEVEGARDEKAIAIRLVKKQNKEIASRFKSIQADARQIKHYRAKVLGAIRDTAKTRLHEQHIKMSGNSALFFSSLDWFYEDLVLVEDQLAQRFPPDWKIYTQFVKAYHKSLYDFVRTIVEAEPEAASLLYLAQFCKEYYKNMTKELDIPPELIEPKLLDGKEGDLLDDYVLLVRKKLDEWTANLMKSETADFTKREQEPDVDPDGQYLMQGAPIMFQMINQQTDLALDSNQGAVVAKVVEEFNRTIRTTQSTWLKLIDSEFARQTARPDESPGGLEHYLMALANDQVKSADFTETLSGRLEALVSEKYRVPIADRLNDAMDGYLDVAKRCIQVLIDTVFTDIKPAVRILFTTSWYVDEPIHQITETITDYMADFQSKLSPSLFDLLVDDTVDTFLITYLSALRRSSKLKMPHAINKIREEVKKSFDCFAEYKPRSELETYFEPLDDVIRILSASKTMFSLDYHPFAQRYGSSAAVPFVEALLRARGDLDKSDVKDIMEGIRRRPPDADPEYPSIFSRLPVEQSSIGSSFNTNFNNVLRGL